jgi:hypothetical protein
MNPIDSGRRRSHSAIDQAGSISLRYLRANPKAKLPSLEKWARYEGTTKTVLNKLFDVLGAETRVYTVGTVERQVRLLNHLTALVREQGESGEGEEVMLLHDGAHVCVIFGLRTRSDMHVRPLTERDEIRLPAW